MENLTAGASRTSSRGCGISNRNLDAFLTQNFFSRVRDSFAGRENLPLKKKQMNKILYDFPFGT